MGGGVERRVTGSRTQGKGQRKNTRVLTGAVVDKPKTA